MFFRPRHQLFAFILLATLGLAACNGHKATVVPGLQVNKKSAEMGTPIEVTYSFSPKKDYVALAKDMTVFTHFLDPKRNIRFQDDHEPPFKTSQWRPNGNYHYTRTVFVPKNIPAGEYNIEMGIYSSATGERLQLDARDVSHRSYDMGKLLIEIPPQEPIIQYSKGWYDPESETSDPSVRWRWTKKEAVLKVRNPGSDALLYFKGDSNPQFFKGQPQQVTISVGNNVIETFPITSNQPFMKKYEVPKAKLGNDKMLEIKVSVDISFVPAQDNVSADTRELGMRVYELYLGKASD